MLLPCTGRHIYIFQLYICDSDDDDDFLILHKKIKKF